jgi:hypothetical protein
MRTETQAWSKDFSNEEYGIREESIAVMEDN